MNTKTQSFNTGSVHGKQQRPGTELECGPRQRANTNEKINAFKSGAPRLDGDFWGGQGEQEESNGAKSQGEADSAASEEARVSSMLQMLRRALDVPLLVGPQAPENTEKSQNPSAAFRTVRVDFMEHPANTSVITNPRALLSVLDP